MFIKTGSDFPNPKLAEQNEVLSKLSMSILTLHILGEIQEETNVNTIIQPEETGRPGNCKHGQQK